MNLPEAIQAVLDDQDLSREQMTEVMTEIMTGGATPAQIGGFLIGLRKKGESVSEITAAATVMRQLASRVEVATDHLVDTCGTGGDGSDTFNISTASALVAAAAGARVAKHGNRSASSRSGSADVLEAAGVDLTLPASEVAARIDSIGIGFMFAPAHHSAMKHAIGPRKEMKVRTIFNLLGPLTNPAGAPNQVIGLFSDKWLLPLAEVLKSLGSKHVLLLHSDDGLDEMSIAGATQVAELKKGEISTYSVTPEQFGLARQPIDALTVNSPEESLAIIQSVFDNQSGPARDIVQLNAGAAIYVSGVADSLEAGVATAGEVIAQGLAKQKLAELVAS